MARMKLTAGLPFAVSLVVVVAGLCLTPQTGSAKPEYTRRTKLACERCHPPDSRQLTEAGEYFRTHGYKMDGYKEPTPAKQDPPKQGTDGKAKSK